jgi:voltage-gated potassium channel
MLAFSFNIKRFRRTSLSILLILATMAMGILGYILIEDYTFLESFYMTVITAGTVGFMEVKPLSDAGRIFTAFLIMVSFGTFAYSISAIAKSVVEGEFNNFFKIYKLENKISKLRDHVIVCGYGRNGRQSAVVLSNHGKDYVLIEKNPSTIQALLQTQQLFIEGDCTQDEVLKKAGIEHASALISTLADDAESVFLTLTARSLRSDITIISRASDESSYKKLLRAGADNVIMPDKIGGAHMASLIMRPDMVEFLDILAGQEPDSVKLMEVVSSEIPQGLIDRPIGHFIENAGIEAKLIGLKNLSGEYIINPSDEIAFSEGTKIFFLGTPEEIRTIRNFIAQQPS